MYQPMYHANMHLHSTYSDAAFTPKQLVLIGKALGYKALILTDHETDGGWPEFSYAAKGQNIDTFVGAEFYGNFEGKSLHLTALDYDYNDPCIREFIRRRCEKRTEYTRVLFERALENGWIEGITWEQIMALVGPDTWVCHDTVQNIVKTLRIVPYDFDWSTFRKNAWFSPEAKALKGPGFSPTAEEVIHVVRNAGGVVALAHPEGQVHLVEKLLDFGLNGIEVCHPDISNETVTLATEAAKAFNLYRCGGTDHTGPMSACGGHLAIPAFHGISEEDYNILKERRLD